MKPLKAFLTAIGLALCIVLAAPPAARGDTYVVGSASRNLLEETVNQQPDNYAALFYLGKVYLSEENREGAISAWNRYLATAPTGDPKTDAVRERLTVLKLRQATQDARRAVRDGETAVPGQVEKNTLAVFNFQPTGIEDGPALSKGLTAMIITDLSQIPRLQVVERERMQALLQEIRLGQTGIVDRDTAVKSGRLLLARHLVQGVISPEEENVLALRASVVETINITTMGRPRTRGPRQDFFGMEKEMVFGILETLGMVDLAPAVKEAVEKRHTENMDAFLNYSRGLDFLDRRQFSQARQAFQEAVNLDPRFDLAIEALRSTPDMMPDMSRAEIEAIEYTVLDEEVDEGLDEIETAIHLEELNFEQVDTAQDDVVVEVLEPLEDSGGSIRIEW
jgi:tetratricopeptide (TPR) repeat protein